MLEVALNIPFWLELAATVSGAIFGAMSAMRARYDLFGVCCIAIVVGLAGGMLRDVLLQNYGIYAFQNPNLIIACIIAGIVVFYFGKLVTYFDPAIDLLDNVSVALWAVIGTGKAMSAGLDLVPAVILGTMTANGGGIMRDICMNRECEAFKAGTLYVTAALIGCIAYYLIKQSHMIDAYAGIISVFVVLAVRYAAIFFGWRTKPPRDYSDSVIEPVKSVARRVTPLRGRTENGTTKRTSVRYNTKASKQAANKASKAAGQQTAAASHTTSAAGHTSTAANSSANVNSPAATQADVNPNNSAAQEQHTPQPQTPPTPESES